MDIYIVWDMHADSWNGIRTVKSIHETLEGAKETIPEYALKCERPKVRDEIVANYGYFSIEKRRLIP